MARDLTCIICPRGCHLHIDDELNVTGNACPRGAAYAKQEVLDPRRTLTSTVKCKGKLLSVCPVKSAEALPKDKIFAAMEEINAITLTPPVHLGDVIKKDLAGTGIALLATRDILE